MLSEADLQELRGMAFDRLLLQVWPTPALATRGRPCISCGQFPSSSRGLCKRCYGRWWNGRAADDGRPIEPLPSAFADQCDEILMARRIGVSRATMRHWRDGTQIPKLSTVRPVAANLESEFGIPAALWLEAAYISNCMMGWVLNESRREFIRNYAHVPASTQRLRAAENLIGRQFGYWLVLDTAGVRRRGGQLYFFAKVKCLLCGEVKEGCLKEIKSGDSSKCTSCARRLASHAAIRHSQFRGVGRERKKSGRYYWKVGGEDFPRRPFSDEAEAARYYDACMYERYGHTLFLNFPDEYDRSNDPVFVPVNLEAASGP